MILIDEVTESMDDVSAPLFPSIHSEPCITASGTPYLVRPGVAVLSRPNTYRRNLEGFLGGFDVARGPSLGFLDYLEDPDRDAMVDGEHIAMIAGQTCFDNATEILTRRGWVLFSALKPDDDVMTLNAPEDRVEFQRPTAIHGFEYDGSLMCWDGRDVSIAVTPDHRQWGRFSTKGGLDQFVRTADINGRHFSIRTHGGGWVGVMPSRIQMPDVEWGQRVCNQHGEHGKANGVIPGRTYKSAEEIECLAMLCVYYATEGSLRKLDGCGMTIYGDHVAEVQRIACTLGLPTNVYVDKRNGVPRVSVGGGRSIEAYFGHECGEGSASKRLPRWVLDLPCSLLQNVWDLLVRTDGSKSLQSNGRSIEVLCTTSNKIAGQAQEILCKLGFAASISESPGVNYPCLTVRKRVVRPTVLNRRVRMVEVPYIGSVYCVTVPNGIVCVRRNMKVHFSGNCYLSFGEQRSKCKDSAAYLDRIKSSAHGSVLEHANYSLLLYGISRSVTHELVRHRAGVGYCLAGDTEVYSGSKSKGRFDGVKKRWTIKRLYEMSKDWRRKSRVRLATVRCFDGTMFVPAKIRAVIESGMKDLFKVTLADGKSVRCSADHRFLTPDGWKPVRELQVGEALGTNGLPAVGLDKSWLDQRYHGDGALLQEIAEEAGCSTHTVRKYLRRYGLQKQQGQGQLGRFPPNKGKRYKIGPFHIEEAKRLFSEAKRGHLNPMWLGDAASPNAGRFRARKAFPTRPCESCGRSAGHRHHMDRNTLNNNSDNIEFLCASCHKRRHLEEDGPSNILTVKWSAIAAIEPDGHEMTYDLEVDHDAHNFVANGIVTHNSQVSQRYVNGKTLRFVERPEFQSHPELHDRFGKRIDAAAADYELLAGDLNFTMSQQINHLPATERRKAVNQAARACLPNETEAPMVMTANVRAWRHYIEMRASRHADVEIRVLAYMVYRCLNHCEPNLFCDYAAEILLDGTVELTTPYRKV